MSSRPFLLLIWTIFVFNFQSRGIYSIVISSGVMVLSWDARISAMACGVMLFTESLARWFVLQIIKQWPQTKVIEMDFKSQSGHSDYGFRLDCRYSFCIQGTLYNGTTVNPFMPDGGADEKEIEDRSFIIGSIGKVRYYPKAPELCFVELPSVSSLIREVTRLVLYFLLFSICIFVLVPIIWK